VTNAQNVQVYVKPSPSRLLDGDQKLVVQLQLSERAAPNDHSPGKKSGKKRKAAYNSDSNNNNNNEGGEEENADFGDCSGEDGEVEVVEVAGPSESAGGLPAKRRRSNHGPSCVVPATPRNAAAAAVDDDAEWTGNLRGGPAITHLPLRRNARRRTVAQKPGQGTFGATAGLDDEVIEISD
jgi:hypothetical protein